MVNTNEHHLVYAILLSGEVNPNRFQDLEPITIELTADGNTRLIKSIKDQAELFGVLNRVRDLGVRLLRVEISQ
ncbi:hypothetical protein ADN00_05660 [Ornatilinea apprima]|uniref:Uncharacterized protein n=1 Tax=Ornatilinea apprima TaxID=1134406 RepID=A0A0P6X6P3_9CHLR|nr:hypothetical protein [Ornatilinea apprima]KPL78728.1 hypothetical protein ADN00_05660 [Ornatilinea apprima]